MQQIPPLPLPVCGRNENLDIAGLREDWEFVLREDVGGAAAA